MTKLNSNQEELALAFVQSLYGHQSFLSSERLAEAAAFLDVVRDFIATAVAHGEKVMFLSDIVKLVDRLHIKIIMEKYIAENAPKVEEAVQA